MRSVLLQARKSAPNWARKPWLAYRLTCCFRCSCAKKGGSWKSAAPVTIRVTDDGPPSLSAEETILITVREVNEPPVVQLVAPPEGSQFVAPATIVLQAVVGVKNLI
jgi:hypothetical protein